MTTYETKMQFQATQSGVSGYCCRCGITIPVEKISCTMDINLSPAAESDQLRVCLNRAFPYTSGEDPRTTFMGFNCPHCGKPMAFIDTEVAPFIKPLNRMKLFTVFSCEGHYEERTDPTTGIRNHSECSSPYISFIGNGRVIRDIILWNLLEAKCSLIMVGPNEYTLDRLCFTGTNPDYQKLRGIKIDVNCSTIYAMIDQTDRFSFNKAKIEFKEAMCQLIYLLPDWIRNWYDNCTDDGKYFMDTEKKKAAYKQIWDNNEYPEELIRRYQNEGGSLNEFE